VCCSPFLVEGGGGEKESPAREGTGGGDPGRAPAAFPGGGGGGEGERRGESPCILASAGIENPESRAEHSHS